MLDVDARLYIGSEFLAKGRRVSVGPDQMASGKHDEGGVSGIEPRALTFTHISQSRAAAQCVIMRSVSSSKYRRTYDQMNGIYMLQPPFCFIMTGNLESKG